ncbi:HAD-IA family hydrolase [Oleisolibacter albus]|uniref:HAD-IA family hydrolase n=1 Tax=Oleisolibacter albus TaxID=2171757 RepID=UPI000DF1ACFF|nr:HAD-IA family hydrolase [Oleisolibacter albus]
MANFFSPERSFGAFLFDMDGTVISSIAATERVWSAWARRHGVDVARFLPTIHGVRAIDTVRRQNLPGIDVEAEAAAVTRAEIEDVDGIVPIEGAAAFLASLPSDRWAVVTSAPRALAESRLGAAGLPLPAVVVTAEDVARGKPAPDGFQLAARRLGQDPADCLVFEDAPAGIAAAEAAGGGVVVVTALHHQPLATPHPTIPGYSALVARQGADGRLRLEHRD